MVKKGLKLPETPAPRALPGRDAFQRAVGMPCPKCKRETVNCPHKRLLPPENRVEAGRISPKRDDIRGVLQDPRSLPVERLQIAEVSHGAASERGLTRLHSDDSACPRPLIWGEGPCTDRGDYHRESNTIGAYWAGREPDEAQVFEKFYDVPCKEYNVQYSVYSRRMPLPATSFARQYSRTIHPHHGHGAAMLPSGNCGVGFRR
ncbi:hypothetical protein CYMTET_21225 [Cymbomonas tetramitiformis]|uniref:Uncharacterized protein n=1 Tax=Cymbomonas tetramitiformis TaxID=36881 RepID=A0AAE0G2F3_9CHLO|nr:hypothetical protein CYMTET_21225 [Cymbomonas tetramitiformis]